MRLIKYLSLSCPDSKTNIFRSLSIKLTERENPAAREIVEEVTEKYNIPNDVLTVIDELNKELKKNYRGKYRFDLCVEEGLTIDKVRIRDSEHIRRKFFEANSYLSKVQLNLEKKLTEETDK